MKPGETDATTLTSLDSLRTSAVEGPIRGSPVPISAMA